MENSFFMWWGGEGEKHNKIFIHANTRKGAFSVLNFYVVFEWGALDSNTISSVICCSCQ